MIIHLCDLCGAETSRGKNLRFQKLDIQPRLTNRWKQPENKHSETRVMHVAVQFGIDGINPEVEHDGHDLCPVCQHKILLAVLRRVEETTE